MSNKLRITLNLSKINHLSTKYTLNWKSRTYSTANHKLKSSWRAFDHLETVFFETRPGLFEVFSLKKAQGENERSKSKLQDPKRIEFANQFLQKQQLDRNKMSEQFNQPDTVVQADDITLEKPQMISSTWKTKSPQQITWSDSLIRNPFNLKQTHEENHFLQMAGASAKNFLSGSTKALLFQKTAMKLNQMLYMDKVMFSNFFYWLKKLWIEYCRENFHCCFRPN